MKNTIIYNFLNGNSIHLFASKRKGITDRQIPRKISKKNSILTFYNSTRFKPFSTTVTPTTSTPNTSRHRIIVSHKRLYPSFNTASYRHRTHEKKTWPRLSLRTPRSIEQRESLNQYDPVYVKDHLHQRIIIHVSQPPG